MSQVFARKTNHAFYQTVLTVIIALTVMVFASLKAYQISSLYLAVLVHKIKDACGCESMAQFFAMHPNIFRAAILFGIGISVFVLCSLYKLVRFNSQTKKYVAHYLSFARAGHSAKLKAAIRLSGMDKARIVEIENCESTVFCFGFLNPKICISRALIDILEKDELKAVLAHEAQHMTAYEPLKVFIVKYFRSVFFFLPGIKTSVKKYITFSELAADEQAGGSAAAKSGLASAILKISGQEESRRQESGMSFSFFSPVIEERANRLYDEAYEPKFKFLDRSLIVGSLGLAVASVIFIFVFSTSTKAFEMHNIAGCVTPADPGSDLACTALENRQNIFNSDNANFQNNTDITDLSQHSTCEAD